MWVTGPTAGLGILVLLLVLILRRRSLHRWIVPYIRETGKRRQAMDTRRDVHLLLCIADHFEPFNGGVSLKVARSRVEAWVQRYPVLFDPFRDRDGLRPRHTFFYPVEAYDRRDLDDLAGLCRAGYGEVEIHLHHDRDTPENLRRTLIESRDILHERHGLLARHQKTGEVQFGFVHGNWALDNARCDGSCCGVNNEIDILIETGCYADFTLPAVPDPAQTRKINSIYWAIDDPNRPRSHDWGPDVASVRRPDNSLMMIQGPLMLDWRRRKWGIVPRIENGCLQRNQPPDASRIDLWLNAAVRVPTRPDWYFVKLHTHGAPERNRIVLLGEAMKRFHESLAQRAQADTTFHFHYVTAREMYNLARAAAAGWRGAVAEARDFELIFTGGLVKAREVAGKAWV